MTYPALAFAVPGDITTLTGGYIYDRRIIEGLRSLGHNVHHIELPASYPYPTQDVSGTTAALLGANPDDRPMIIDGLAYGAIPTSDLAQITSPMIALVHHPLAKEGGSTPARNDHLFQTERNNLALARHTLVPSPHTAAILVSEYDVPRDRITVVRPGTDRPTGGDAKTHPPVILSVGIQARRKGHDILLMALAKIMDLPWQAVIVGAEHEPEHARQLISLTDALGLGDRVQFTGQVSSQALTNYYQEASIFALATRYEGYGIVFDEAQAHGLPIVSCATGAVPDTVPPQTRILVPPDAPAPFATALRSLLLNPEHRERLTRAARLASLSFPSWEDAARQTSRAITNAISQDVR